MWSIAVPRFFIFDKCLWGLKGKLSFKFTMKKIFYLAGCLLLAGALCWSCTDDDGDDSGNGNGNGSGNGSVVLDKDTQTEQVVYANDKGSDDEGIKFTAQGPWTAVVEDVTTKDANAETVDWLTLSQYSGDKAGDYTITLTLKQNFTGKTRKAKIHITCGETTITITVEQKAEKENGVTLKRVKSVNHTTTYGAGYYEDGTVDETTFTYSYDEQGRVAKVVEQENSYWDSSSEKVETYTYTFDYHIVGEITVDYLNEYYYQYNDGSGQESKSEYDGKYVLTLNDYGNVVNIKGSGYCDDTDTNVGYTEDGRLGKLWSDDYGYEWYETYYYTDGLLTKFEFYESGDSTEVQEFKVDELYPNRYPANGTNIDFNAFITSIGADDIEGVLYQIGLLGKGSDCLVEIGGYSDSVEYGSSMYTYTEPDKVYTYSGTYTQYPENETLLPVNYEFDGDKYVTKFSYEDPYELYEYSYEIHVGSELWDEDYPEMGYKYETKNYTSKKLSDEKNVYSYTVTYE